MYDISSCANGPFKVQFLWPRTICTPTSSFCLLSNSYLLLFLQSSTKMSLPLWSWPSPWLVEVLLQSASMFLRSFTLNSVITVYWKFHRDEILSFLFINKFIALSTVYIAQRKKGLTRRWVNTKFTDNWAPKLFLYSRSWDKVLWQSRVLVWTTNS